MTTALVLGSIYLAASPVLAAAVESAAAAAGQWGPAAIGGLVGGLVGSGRAVKREVTRLLALHVEAWHRPALGE